jgi:hypothetical protein
MRSREGLEVVPEFGKLRYWCWGQQRGMDEQARSCSWAEGRVTPGSHLT